jgi:hypothetical protein
MKTLIDIRICYEIIGNDESLRNADILYRQFQEEFIKMFPEAVLSIVHIAKSEVKDEK